MFTGIIEDLGTVRKSTSSGMAIETRLKEIKSGDSISVNGVCLTVTQLAKSGKSTLLSFDTSPETRMRSSLGSLRIGSQVNLERAMRVGDRLGGHFMSGHIEGTAILREKVQTGSSWVFTFAIEPGIRKYIVPKGSVGVDGVSLTIVGRGNDYFTVSLIPHTLENTNLRDKMPGEFVNLEPDILAKYMESMIVHNPKKTTKELLDEFGFLQ